MLVVVVFDLLPYFGDQGATPFLQPPRECIKVCSGKMGHCRLLVISDSSLNLSRAGVLTSLKSAPGRSSSRAGRRGSGRREIRHLLTLAKYCINAVSYTHLTLPTI